MSKLTKQRLLFWLLAGAIFALDQWTKNPFRTDWQVGESIPFSPYLYITYVQNTGSLWGMFSQHTLVLGLISLTVSLGIVYYVYRMREQITLMYITLGILLGGALGNMYDRLFFGYVVDFFDLRWNGKNYWAIFNVADIAIDLAIVLFLWMAFREPKSSENEKLAREQPEADLDPSARESEIQSNSP